MLSFYLFPSNLQSFGDELNRSSKTAPANIWAHKNLKQIFGYFKLRFQNELLHWQKIVFWSFLEQDFICWWEKFQCFNWGNPVRGPQGRGSFRPRGEDGYLGERGNTGQPGFSCATPQDGWNYVKSDSFILLSLIDYQCVKTWNTHSTHIQDSCLGSCVRSNHKIST